METAARRSAFSEIRMKDREHIDISGVDEVISYDENGLCLTVGGSRLVVEGENVHVSSLNVEEGRIVADGRIRGLSYEDAPRNGGCLFGLFKKQRP